MKKIEKITEKEFLNALNFNSLYSCLYHTDNDRYANIIEHHNIQNEDIFFLHGERGDYLYSDYNDEYYEFVESHDFPVMGVTSSGKYYTTEAQIPYFIIANCINGNTYVYYSIGNRTTFLGSRDVNDVYYSTLSSIAYKYSKADWLEENIKKVLKLFLYFEESELENSDNFFKI